MLRNVVSLKSVFVRGRYDGNCPGWVYDKALGGYLKEVINSKACVLSKEVLDLRKYANNGLFFRFEVVRNLNDDVFSDEFIASQPPGPNVLRSLTPDTKGQIYRRNGVLMKEEIMKYLKISHEEQNNGRLQIGNFKYCRGRGELFEGDGLYIKYIRCSDFTALFNVIPLLARHYKICPATSTSPAGYFYHDMTDESATREYACVNVVSKSPPFVNRDEERGSEGSEA
jgi:hypothetical protein